MLHPPTIGRVPNTDNVGPVVSSSRCNCVVGWRRIDIDRLGVFKLAEIEIVQFDRGVAKDTIAGSNSPCRAFVVAAVVNHPAGLKAAYHVGLTTSMATKAGGWSVSPANRRDGSWRSPERLTRRGSADLRTRSLPDRPARQSRNRNRLPEQKHSESSSHRWLAMIDIFIPTPPFPCLVSSKSYAASTVIAAGSMIGPTG